MAQVENHISDVRAVEQLTCLTDISRLLHETLATERGLEAELDQLLSSRGDLEQNLLALHSDSREVCVGHIQLLAVAQCPNCYSLNLSPYSCTADTGGGQGGSRDPRKQCQADIKLIRKRQQKSAGAGHSPITC